MDRVGLADAEAGQAVTPESVLNVGSVSKLVTATAVLRTVEAGLLDLDADVSGYLPFPVRHPAAPERPIMARQLLTHSAGLSDSDAYGASYAGGDPAVSTTISDLARFVAASLPGSESATRLPKDATRAAVFRDQLLPGLRTDGRLQGLGWRGERERAIRHALGARRRRPRDSSPYPSPRGGRRDRHRDDRPPEELAPILERLFLEGERLASLRESNGSQVGPLRLAVRGPERMAP